MQSRTTSVGTRNIKNELIQAFNGKTLFETDDEEIATVLSYGIVLLGINPDKVPKTAIEDAVINNYLRKTFPNFKVDEVRNAFDYALEGRIKVETKLYGGTFSASFVANIIKAYIKLRDKVVVEPKPEPMTNLKKAGHIFDQIKKRNPELYAQLKDIGKEKKPSPVEKQPYTPEENKFQSYLKEFDAIRMGKDHKGDWDFIEYKGETMNLEKYFTTRLDEDKESD